MVGVLKKKEFGKINMGVKMSKDIDGDKVELSLQRLDTIAAFLLDTMNNMQKIQTDAYDKNVKICKLHVDAAIVTKAAVNQMYYEINEVIDLLRVEFIKKNFRLNPEHIENRLNNNYKNEENNNE